MGHPWKVFCTTTSNLYVPSSKLRCWQVFSMCSESSHVDGIANRNAYDRALQCNICLMCERKTGPSDEHRESTSATHIFPHKPEIRRVKWFPATHWETHRKSCTFRGSFLRPLRAYNWKFMFSNVIKSDNKLFQERNCTELLTGMKNRLLQELPSLFRTRIY